MALGTEVWTRGGLFVAIRMHSIFVESGKQSQL